MLFLIHIPVKFFFQPSDFFSIALNDCLVDALISQQFASGLHYIILAFQKAQFFPAAFHSNLKGGNLPFVKSTVPFHKVGMLDVFQPFDHLWNKVISFLCKTFKLLSVTAAHDVRHFHIIVDGLCAQPEPFNDCFTESPHNLLFINSLGVADSLSIVDFRCWTKPDRIVLGISHTEKPAAFPTQNPS